MKTSAKRAARRLPVAGMSLIVLGTVAAAQNELSPAHPAQPWPGAELRNRLSDPVQRAQVRANTRKQMQSVHADLLLVLDLDAGRESKLIDVLTDQHVASMERFLVGFSDSGTPASSVEEARMNMLQRQADDETRKKQQIRDVLGEEHFECYLHYLDTVDERRQTLYFDARLEERDRLTADQRDRLIALLRAQRDMQIARREEAGSRVPPSTSDSSQATLKAIDIAVNEEKYRMMQEESRALLQQLPTILTPRQLEAYTGMEAWKLESQRKYTQRLRIDAGTAVALDETLPNALLPKRALLAGKVRLEISFTANGEEPVDVGEWPTLAD